MAVAKPSGGRIRISKIAGRYLLFDVNDVVHIRRHHNICSVLVGTTPQNPTQNLFSGLPLELTPEEARLLVDKDVAYIADDPSSHLQRLGHLDDSSRRAYLESLKTRRWQAQRLIDEEAAQKSAESAEKRAKEKAKKRAATGEQRVDLPEQSLFGQPSPGQGSIQSKPAPRRGPDIAVTPAASADLLGSPSDPGGSVPVTPSYPLFAHLNDAGYFITPGIRFGCDYSVYPGDPFRFHAHFMATSYGWDEQIPLLDLIGSGRLATAVKKGYLLGGQKPPPDGAGESGEGDGVRTFCLEWAGM